jgi:hypothetical protein
VKRHNLRAVDRRNRIYGKPYKSKWLGAAADISKQAGEHEVHLGACIQTMHAVYAWRNRVVLAEVGIRSRW